MNNFKRAFSFIEIILVVAILGLVAAVFVPATVKIRKKAREDAITLNVTEIVEAGKKYNVEKGTKSVDYKTLVDSKYIDARKSIAGESYDAIKIESTGGKVTLANPFGDTIEMEY